MPHVLKEGTYYAAWPFVDRKVSLQLAEGRHNTTIASRLITNTWFDQSGSSSTRTQVAGFNLGSESFRNKFRIILE